MKKLVMRAAVLVAVCLSGWAWAQPLPEGVAKVASVEGITEYRLDNGLRVLLFPDESKRQITVNITYLVGSRHESYGETGMAHLLEHLVFKGTPNHPDISAELTERGAFPNGTTWLDRTNYFETFPATDDNLEWALDLEADRMINSFISAEDLESEMTVVRNEWESGENSPFGVLRRRVTSAAYNWHNYGNSTIGARSDIENVPIERLQAFYRKYYQPDNAVLVVAGRFETARALQLVAEKFGPIPRPERTGSNILFETYTAEPAQDGERVVTLRRVGDVQLAEAAFHVPAGSHAQYPAVDVLTHLLSTEPAGRLYKALVEPGLAASAYASSFQFREPGLLYAGVEVRQGDSLPTAVETLLETLEDLTRNPPTEEEVERAKRDYLSRIELSFNNPQGIALQLSEWAAMGDWRLMFLYRDQLETVAPQDVLEVARTYLRPSNRTIGYFYPTEETPTRAEVPPPPDVAALVEGYEGRAPVVAGEAFDPTPGNIESRTRYLTLGNGMEVALLQKQTRGDAVSLSFTLPHGDERSLDGKEMAASLAGGLLMRGTAHRSRQDISDELDRLKVQGGVGSSVFSSSGSFSTVRDSLPEALALVREILREPAFDEKEFELLVEERLANIEAQQSEPNALAQLALNKHLNPRPKGHPYYYPGSMEEAIEDLRATSVEDARAFWAEFAGAGNGALAIVGAFDAEEIIPLLEETFGDWVSSQPYERVPNDWVEIEATQRDIETPDKANAIMLAALSLKMGDDHRDYPAMALANYMLGGGFLSSRLAVRIRQNEGLSYGVGSGFNAQPPHERSVFFAYAIYSPETADRVVQAFREEIDRVRADGFEEEEMVAAKRGYLDAAQNRRASDGVVAGNLVGNLRLDRTMEDIAKFEADVEALTVRKINAAVRRHLDPDKISIFRAGDFAKAAAEQESEEEQAD